MRVKRLWKLCIKRLCWWCAFVDDWYGNYWCDYFVHVVVEGLGAD